METFVIKGGKKLKGTISVSGSKNVALKALVAACLTDEEVIIENIPLISDFMVMVEIIRELGGRVRIKDHTAVIRIKKIKKTKISLEKAASIRTSLMFMAPLLARCGRAVIPNPGGCRIGARPMDRIIAGIKKMGVKAFYNSKDGYFYLSLKNKMKPMIYRFKKNTHTGTETLILSSVLAKGKTILENAAEEPEVSELINLLNLMGADVKRIERRKIVINGVEKLHGTKFRISPDRNEVVTFAIAAIITKGDVFIKDVNTKGLEEFLDTLKKAGGGFEKRKNGIRFYYDNGINSTKVTTSFYPGFMTDWQGPWLILMTQGKGASVIHETVYENRFGYVEELLKMGARIKLYNPKVKRAEKFYNFNLEDNKPWYKHAVKIYGPSNLHNAAINISDLRAGATLVLAALAAEGENIIFGVEHLDRGYENFDKRLETLGGNVKRIKE
ncbi:MAG: UDP-N-acetylglucosamine 1-carboxyvinyltransferase [Candidatus Levybacteria bacterium RIFCSPLOWO2_01_FULL_38_21]|nr:MAG: UDP-N-acetylglucosamine 1-carboxyvinyltransferase [Candidatus Levybacteria bacterium RIFCSPLOWO2_01_FULL_38_21]